VACVYPGYYYTRVADSLPAEPHWEMNGKGEEREENCR